MSSTGSNTCFEGRVQFDPNMYTIEADSYLRITPRLGRLFFTVTSEGSKSPGNCEKDMGRYGTT